MNYDSCDMVKVDDEAAVRSGEVGSFCVVDVEAHGAKFRRLWAHFPDGTVGGFALEPAPAEAIVWPWNGSASAPTLRRRVKLTGRWSGQIVSGRMVSDSAQPSAVFEMPQPPAPSAAMGAPAAAVVRPGPLGRLSAAVRRAIRQR